MNRPLKVAASGAIAALLVSAAALPASAEYLGYGNGDPGNWDFWQEQNGGKAMPSDDQQQAMAQRGTLLQFDDRQIRGAASEALLLPQHTSARAEARLRSREPERADHATRLSSLVLRVVRPPWGGRPACCA